MPIVVERRADPGPGRRSVLVAAVGAGTTALLLGGCGGDGAGRGAHSAAAGMRRRAADGAASLLDRYDATSRTHPGLAARLAPLRAQTAQHVEAFGGEPAPAPPAGSAAASPAASASAAPSPASARPPRAGRPSVAVPADRDEALRALASAASRQSDAFLADLTEAPGDLARLLASVAAACAAHATLLPELTA